MPLTQIKKRSGSIVDFDEKKINRAIAKACDATHTHVGDEVIESITADVLKEAETTFQENVPSVEEVQDIVERKIADHGLFNVAKAYILYRERHKRQRENEQQQLLQRIKEQKLSVVKRDGTTVPCDVNEITEMVSKCAAGEAIDIDSAIHDTLLNLYDGITTKEINQALILALKSRIESDPKYSKLAARVLLNDLYKEILGVDEFSEDFVQRYREQFPTSIRTAIALGRLDPRLANVNLEELATHIDPERDHIFAYLGAQTLYDRYFLRDSNQKILETPQYFWMRVALGLSIEEPDQQARAIEFYDTTSTLHYVPSTPTLFHAGTTHPQMSSCYLTTVEDDLGHIFKCIGDDAQLSKWSGGLGNDWTNIRATGAHIGSTNVNSQGVIPFLKIVDATTAAINRSGRRRGATCVYLETWHLDIEDFLELRKNTGDDRRRTHDINTANWIPDLFMKRVAEDGVWTLFSPEEVPDLHHTYGKDFENRYEEYERKAQEGKMKLFRQIKAQDLWRKMITMLYETGHPWITFKDPSNVRSPQDHIGVVHSSNLCTEITLNTSADETAVCNLGSINLSRHVTDTKIDNEKLAKTVATAMRMLDNVIDLNFYPTKEAKNANLRHRPVGLGIMGLQDAFYKIGVNFDSDEAVELSDEMMETIAYHAIKNSALLAEERGAYESFKGSKWDRGILPLDTLTLLEEQRGIETETPKTTQRNWDEVRSLIKRHGMRNSNCMAIAPTATISNIAGVFPTIEPIYKNIYVKSNVSGEFTTNNAYLIEDLKKHGLWSEKLLAKIKQHDGSIQPLDEIPEDLKEKYKEVFEIDPVWIIKHAARRGKWIDQSQSINIFTNSTSGKNISELYQTAWRKGLKTTYYLRTLGASAIEKSTVETAQKADQPHEHHHHAEQEQAVAMPASANTPLVCEACQ